MPLSGLLDDSLEGLGAAFSGHFAGRPEGKDKEKEKEAVYMDVEEEDPGDENEPSNEVPFDVKPAESTPSASDHPAVSSRTITTLPATHPEASSATTTPSMSEGPGFTAMSHPTYPVTPAATAPPMATAVSERVASSSTYTSIRESMPRCYDDDYHRPATCVYMTDIPGYATPETAYTMLAPGFTSLGGPRGPESCGGRSRGSRRSSNKSLMQSDIREALRGGSADLLGDPTHETRAKLEPLIPLQGSPTTMGASAHHLQANPLVAGLTHILGGVRSRPMPTPALI